MSVHEIRQRIYHLVDDNDNEDALAQLLQNASELLTDQPATLADLTDQQIAGIEKAREEYRQGKVMSVAEMKQKVHNQFPTINI